MQETLQQLVQRRQRELGGSGGPISTRQVWLRGGGEDEWSYETVRRVVELGHANIGDRIADRLAIALDVSVSKILEAAGQRQRGEPFKLPARANRLSSTERNIVRQVIDAMLGQYADERPEDVRPTLRSVQRPADDSSTAGPDLSKVPARRGHSTGRQIREDLDARDEAPDEDPGFPDS